MKKVLELAENGYLPDMAIRTGIRRLNRMRLLRESHGGCESAYKRQLQVIEELAKSPIAISTEKANEQHYEVPPLFFRKVLGERLKYSCCLFEDGLESLSRGEEKMLELVCERAKVKDGQKILDLGCGWGSLTLWLAEHYPNAQICSLSNSKPQRSFIEEKCQSLAYSNVRVITADINDVDLEESFDRIISIEMFEHMRNYGRLFAKLRPWLEEDGRLFVHIFCHRSYTYTFETSSDSDWMGRHFFTGGLMPSEDLFYHFQRDLIAEKRWRLSGLHYAKTAEAWLENLDREKDSILEIFKELYGHSVAEKWFQRWRIFFMACAELFGYGEGNEWWVAHYLFSRR